MYIQSNLGQSLGIKATTEVTEQIRVWMEDNNIQPLIPTQFNDWRRKVKHPKPEVTPGMSVPAVMDYWLPTFESFDQFLAEWNEFQPPVTTLPIKAGITNFLLIIGIGIGSYFAFRKKKKIPSSKRTPRRGVRVARLPR